MNSCVYQLTLYLENMKFTIKRRLQLYLVVFVFGLLIALSWIINYRLQSDFIHYLNEQKHESLDQLADLVSLKYASSPNQWKNFIHKKSTYDELVDHHFSRFSSLDISFPIRPPQIRPDSQWSPESMPPQERHERKPRDNAPLLSDNRTKPPNLSPSANSSIHLDIPVALIRVDGDVIHGQFIGSMDNHFLSPVRDNSRKIIAYFTLPKNTEFSSVQQQAYMGSFKRTLLIVLVIGIFLSLIVAHFLAQVLIRPISRLNDAVTDLKNRNFGANIHIEHDDELGELTLAFNEMSKKLAEYEAQQRKWLGDISHDLRTPVSIIKAEINAVIDGIRPSTQETFHSLMQEINSLSLMLDQFHAIAMANVLNTPTNDKVNQVSTGVNPRLVLQELERRSENAILSANLVLHTAWYNEDITININELELTKIWHNLLQNSLRYTNADSPINGKGTVNIITSVDDENWVLEWQDSEPSVPQELLPKLTEPLFRLEKSRNRQFAGSGLGLSIVKDIVDKANGTIELKHSHLGGLKLIIAIPLIDEV